MKKKEKNTSPLISIIIPVYNVSEYLNRCLDSIINQTYKNIEVILINDGSTDDSLKICNQYKKKDKRIKVLSQQNKGLSGARNSGITSSKGEYIVFVDSDDFVDKKYISTLYNLVSKYKVNLACTSHKAIYSNGKVIEHTNNLNMKMSKEEALERMLYNDGVDVSAWAKIYHRSLFENIRYPEGRIFEDTATTYKLIDSCDYIAVDKSMTYNYMIHSNSITGKKFYTKKLDWILSTVEMINYVAFKYPSLHKACKASLMYSHIGVLSSLAMSEIKYPDEEAMLLKYIKNNKKEYLKDKRVSFNNKLAVYTISISYKLYKVLWKVYQYFTVKRYQ